MNKDNEFCTYKGHEQAQVTHLCMFEDCKLMQKQCCSQFINEEIHNHGQSDNEHIRLRQENQNICQNLPQLDDEDDKNKNKPIDFQKRNYNLRVLGSNFKNAYSTCSISNNEKYLAYGSYKIRNYEFMILRKISSLKKLNVMVQFQCLYSHLIQNSFIFLNTNNFSAVQGYDVQKNLKKTFKQNINTKYIIDFFTINNQIFDYKYDLLISGSCDKSLKLWDCGQRKIIINKKYAITDDIIQIQLINDIQNVLTLEKSTNFIKWKIDLINKSLFKLQEYQDPNNIIQRFQQIHQNQNFLFICDDYIKIVDQEIKFDGQIQLFVVYSY